MEEGYVIEPPPFEVKTDINEALFKELGGKRVFKGANTCNGCGSLLALKLALQALPENTIFVMPEGITSSVVTKFSTLIVDGNHVATAAGAARAVDKAKVVCFAGDTATRSYLQSVMASANRNDNVLYICHNNQGSCRLGRAEKHRGSLVKQIKTPYAATASIAFPEDYVNKLRKAYAMKGFALIDVMAPCPKLGDFDTSNTVQVARLAVQSRLWPLIEIERNSITITKRPDQEPVKRYFEIQGRFRDMKEDEIIDMQRYADSLWRTVSEGRHVF